MPFLLNTCPHSCHPFIPIPILQRTPRQNSTLHHHPSFYLPALSFGSMNPEIPRILSTVASEPALVRWVHCHDPDRDLDRDLLKSSVTYISDILSQSATNSATTASLLVPMYSRAHYVLGQSYGNMSPNTMVLNMLSADGYCDPPDPICRRFVVDMSSPDSLQFLEYEWFSDGKVCVSSHTIDSNECYQGETFLLDSPLETGRSNHTLMSKADLFVAGRRPPFPTRVAMKLRFTEILDCPICIANQSAKCVCIPTVPDRHRTQNQFVVPPNWEAWIHAFAQSRRRLAAMKVAISVMTPQAKNDSSMNISLQQKCESGVDLASKRGHSLLKTYMKAAGMLVSHPHTGQPLAASKRTNEPRELENRLSGMDENLNQLQLARQHCQGRKDEVVLSTDSFTRVAPSRMDSTIAQKLEQIVASSLHDIRNDDDPTKEPNSRSVIHSAESANSASQSREIPDQSQDRNEYLSHPTLPSQEIPRRNFTGEGRRIERDTKKGQRKGIQKVKVFECECGKVFRHRGHFNEHRMCVHEKVRQHQCLITNCESRFFKKSDRDRHMRSKHGDKIAKCTECGALLVKGPLYDAHIRDKHRRLSMNTSN